MTRRADNVLDERRAEELMRLAVDLTAGTRPHPNPRVGAIVLAADGEILAEKAHEGPGSPHAEAAALASAGDRARSGTLVVTLEPCIHYGRTPPCVGAVLASGVSRVVVGAIDPDDRVAGAGVAQLRDAGIEVITGVGETTVAAADPGYFHHRSTGRPLVTLKNAMTIDGQSAAADGSSQWITSDEARADAHRLRAAADAVMVGAGTLRADDPRLDVRLPGYVDRQPIPVIVADTGPLPTERRVYARSPIVYRSRHADDDPSGAEVVTPPDGPLDLGLVLDDLGERGIVDLLVEGGPTLAGALLRGGLVDRLVTYVGARVAAGAGTGPVAGPFSTITDSRSIRVDGVRSVGPDVRIDAVVGGR